MIDFIAPAQLHLSAEQKLQLLKQLDRWRPWKSLDDRRLCLGCGRLISGHEIEIVQQAEHDHSDQARCPTEGCQSIPLDWILPNRRREPEQV